MNNLTTKINYFKEFLSIYIQEGNIDATITADNTGELMDSAIDLNCNIIKPFEDSFEQNYYYFIIKLNPLINIKVKSLPKKLKE